MTQRLMGLETEYATVIFKPGGTRASAHAACEMLISRARRRLAHLPGENRRSLFLANGSRFYEDSGHHPEFCTPEVHNPDDVVRYVVANEAILRELVEDIRTGSGPAAATPTTEGDSGLTLFKCNVDYAQPRVTWACHESYMHRAVPRSMPAMMIPHLISRIYCGAGGLDPTCPGIRFSLAPRLHTFVTAVSCSTTGDRGIYNTRDEPLAGNGYRRMHIICSDAVCSHTSIWLKMATTCLVVMLGEAGCAHPLGDRKLAKPVDALHAFLVDPDFRTTAQLTDGTELTALEIQRLYLEAVETHVVNATGCNRSAPPWAATACRRWRSILDRLEQGPAAVERTLDWAVKYPLYMDHIRRSGIDADTLPLWNKTLTELQAGLRKTGSDAHLTEKLVMDARSPIRDAIDRISPKVVADGIRWEDVGKILRVRNELGEIDMRFSEIAPGGIFRELEPQLDHRVAGVEGFDTARDDPPRGTRAQRRGEEIRRLCGKQGYYADWACIGDPDGGILDLSDPLSLDAEWKRVPEPTHDATIEEAERLYRRGEYGRMRAIASCITPPPGAASLSTRLSVNATRSLPLMARAQVRLGQSHQALMLLADAVVSRPGAPDSLVIDYLTVYRHRGLSPVLHEARPWITRGDEITLEGLWPPILLARFLGLKGALLARSGQVEEAEEVLRTACANRLGDRSNTRLVEATNLVELADVLRIRGRRVAALRRLTEAFRIYEQEEFTADKADYLIARAKLERDHARARSCLRRARQLQTCINHRVGLARTLLLEARISPTKWTATRRRRSVEQIVAEVPDLQTCQLVTMILDRWEEWSTGAPVEVHGDFYWLV